MPLGKQVTSLTDDVAFKTKPVRHPTLFRVDGGICCCKGMEVLIPSTDILGQNPVNLSKGEAQRNRNEVLKRKKSESDKFWAE